MSGPADDDPAREQGTWIIRRPICRGRSPAQRELPLDNAASRRPQDNHGGDVVGPADLDDAEFRRLLLDSGGDDDLDDLLDARPESNFLARFRPTSSDKDIDGLLQELAAACEEALMIEKARRRHQRRQERRQRWRERQQPAGTTG